MSQRYHIILIIDASQSMQGRKLESVKEALKEVLPRKSIITAIVFGNTSSVIINHKSYRISLLDDITLLGGLSNCNTAMDMSKTIIKSINEPSILLYAGDEMLTDSPITDFVKWPSNLRYKFALVLASNNESSIPLVGFIKYSITESSLLLLKHVLADITGSVI